MTASGRTGRAARALAVVVFVLVSCGSAGASGSATTVASDGHPTHPVWYHDGVAVAVGSKLFVAWNTDRASVEARAWNLATSAWAGSARRVSVARLDCSCVDSTKKNPNRHDVPTLFADPAGRVYALYGGGTASRTGSTGPYFRAASGVGTVSAWGPEQRLSIPGAAYDFEAVRDNLGVTHLVGQQGGNESGAGSLVYLRFLPGTSVAPGTFETPVSRTLVRGGYDPGACGWQPKPGCDVFVIGRIAVGPSDPSTPSAPSALYVVWGWSEKNLSNTCGDPAGFCNHGLYVARSTDGGRTWTNMDGTASTDLSRSPIGYADPRYAVVPRAEDVGLFKAVTITGAYPGTPWIAYQPGADRDAGKLDVVHIDGASRVTKLIDGARSWNNHLVMRVTSSGRLILWSDIAQTGANAGRIDQWVAQASQGEWSKSQLDVGRSWFLTGAAAGDAEVLVWRAPGSPPASRVAMTIVPTP